MADIHSGVSEETHITVRVTEPCLRRTHPHALALWLNVFHIGLRHLLLTPNLKPGMPRWKTDVYFDSA